MLGKIIATVIIAFFIWIALIISIAMGVKIGLDCYTRKGDSDEVSK